MSLANSDVQTTRLSQELEFVTGYLEIEKMWFEDRLGVVFDIHPETLDAQVPALFLQPLVENAVRHGVSRLSSGGKILVAASHDGHSLKILVKDNGPGLVSTPATPSGTGLGLRATRERLQTLYGNDHVFDVQNGTGGGVEVAVKIPFRTEPQTAEGEEMSPFASPATVH
jgi:two-component system LytT family sensor kinase